MRIEQLSYPFEEDQYVHREASISLGGLSIRAEAVTVAGTEDRPNQDAFGFSLGEHNLRAGVFDGAVSRDASHTARDLLELCPDSLTASQILGLINKGLARFDLKGGASTATMVDVSAKDMTLDVAHVTDSWAMALFRDGSTELLTSDQHERFDQEALRTLAQVAAERGIGMAEARHDPLVVGTLAAMFRVIRNKPDGSGEGILNGSRHMDQYIQTLAWPLNLNRVAAVAIGSDGTRFPYRTETDSSYRDEFFSQLAAYGVAGVVNRIHINEATHPPTPEHPRWSLHDDKTLVVLSFD